MITFFRRLRQKLIDSGNITKYLLYALGEILLVVIGILIALQVNNWNEERKNDKLMDQYLISLKTDLEEDLKMLHVGFEAGYADSVQLASQISRIRASQSHPDTIKSIILYEFQITVRAPRPFNRKTYSTLISTGDIGLLENEIVERLVQLIRDQDIRTRLVEAAIDGYLDNFVPFNNSYPVGDLPFSEDLIPVIYDDIDAIQMLGDFSLLAAFKILNNERIMLRKRILEPQIKELIDLIDQSIV